MKRQRQNAVSLFSFQDIITGLCGIMIFMVLVQIVSLAVGDGGGGAENASPSAEDERPALRREIAALEKKLDEIRRASAKAVVIAKDAAPDAESEKAAKELSEKELALAALVSQVSDLETQVEKVRDASARDRKKVREMERTRKLLESRIAAMKNRKGITLIPQRGESKIPVYAICSGDGMKIVRPFENMPEHSIGCGDVRRDFIRYLGRLDHTTHAFVLLVRPSGVKLMDEAVKDLKESSFTYGRDPLEEDVEIVFAKGGAK